MSSPLHALHFPALPGASSPHLGFDVVAPAIHSLRSVIGVSITPPNALRCPNLADFRNTPENSEVQQLLNTWIVPCAAIVSAASFAPSCCCGHS